MAAPIGEVNSKRPRSVQQQFIHPSRTDAASIQMLGCALPFGSGHFTPVSALSQFLCAANSIPTAIKLVIDIMDSQLDVPEVQYCGLRVLSEWGTNTMGSKQFVARFMNSITIHFANPMIQYEACRGLLQWMKSDAEVLQEIGTPEHLSLLMESLGFHASSLQLRYTILDIVRCIIGSSKEWLRKISSQNDVVTSVMRLLKKTVSDAYTQQIGLSILSWIIEEKPSRDVILKERGIEHLLNAMVCHPWDDAVQCNAAATLCWLIHTSGSTDSSVLSAKGLAVVMDTMKRFLRNPMVFGNCVCALSGAMIHGFRDDGLNLQTCEVAQLTLLGMRIHKDSPKVHRNGLTLLRFLIINGDDNNEDAGTAVLQNIDVLEASMKGHIDDSAIQAEACGMLAHILSRSAEAQAVITESGCVEAVVQCQMMHRGNLRVQHNALWFHSCLIRDQEMNEAVEAFGGGLRVLATMTAGVLPELNPGDE